MKALENTYTKFAAMPIIVFLNTGFFLVGGNWFWWVLGSALFLGTFFDEWVGDDRSNPAYRHKWLLNLFLYLSLPLLILQTLIYCYFLSDCNFMMIGTLGEKLLGIDMEYRRAATDGLDLLGGALALGFAYGSVGTNVAHELVHRTHSPFEVVMGRMLLAFTCDTTFAIEHIQGHHKHVATPDDPSSSKKGDNVWAFFIHSWFYCTLRAFQYEARRLRRQGHSPWSLRNRALRGQIYSVVVASVYYVAAGWHGVLVFLAVAFYGKAYLEFVNYIEHYGLVRVPGTPVESRHSWNSYRAGSSSFLYNLPRHSHHHMKAAKPYWELRPDADAPTLPYGYLTMILIAGIPPLWRRIVDPLVSEWERKMATPEERALAREMAKSRRL